jgi:hypothetical protein
MLYGLGANLNVRHVNRIIGYLRMPVGRNQLEEIKSKKLPEGENLQIFGPDENIVRDTSNRKWTHEPGQGNYTLVGKTWRS